MSVYGLLEFVTPMPWDAFWLISSKRLSEGQPVPFAVLRHRLHCRLRYRSQHRSRLARTDAASSSRFLSIRPCFTHSIADDARCLTRRIVTPVFSRLSGTAQEVRIRQFAPLRASSHYANFAAQARLRRKLMARQNMRRYTEETILQRDNPLRKFPNWRNRFEASNVS
jgi:hypothetical protein